MSENNFKGIHCRTEEIFSSESNLRLVKRIRNARCCSNHKIAATQDKSKDPQDSEEVEVPESSYGVIPLYVGDWPVSSFLNVSDRVKEKSSHDPKSGKNDSSECIDNWDQKNSLDIIDEVCSSLSFRWIKFTSIIATINLILWQMHNTIKNERIPPEMKIQPIHFIRTMYFRMLLEVS
jgi:hypothetical protein